MVQLVECLLAKEKVTGSSPVARSQQMQATPCCLQLSYKATWPSGKARVCKTLIMGSNPIVASKYLNTIISQYVFKSPEGDCVPLSPQNF